MADSTQMKKNIDKVSYGVAGGLSVILLALPFLLGGAVKESTAKVEKRTDELKDRKSKESVGLEVGELKFSQNELADLWLVSGDSAQPVWRTQRRPAVVRIYSTEPPKEGVHGAPCLTSVELVRNPESRKPLLRVTGEIGEIAYTEVDKVVLERKVGEEGEWAEVPGFAEAGNFSYDDKDVGHGKSYTYRCTSFARAVATNGETSNLKPEDVEKVSNELSTASAIPFDLAMRITNFGDLSQDLTPRYRGIMQVWDYAEGKKKPYREAVASKGWERGFEFGANLDDGKPRYKVRRIVPEDSVVTIDDRLTGTNEKFTQKGTRALRPIDSWDIVTHDCTPAPAGDGTADAGATTADPKKTAAATKSPVKSPGTAKGSGAKGAGTKKTGRSGRRGRAFE